MKKIFAVLIGVLAFAAIAWADNYQTLTVDNTSGGVSLTAATYAGARYAMCRLETAEIRYTKDGSTTPTSAVGMLMEPMEFIVLENANQIRNFKAIRTGDTSGVLKCFFLKD